MSRRASPIRKHDYRRPDGAGHQMGAALFVAGELPHEGPWIPPITITPRRHEWTWHVYSNAILRGFLDAAEAAGPTEAV